MRKIFTLGLFLLAVSAGATAKVANDDAREMIENLADVVDWLSAELDAPAPPEEHTKRLNKRCRNEKLRETGYRFRYPTFREGYRPIVREFVSQSG